MSTIEVNKITPVSGGTTVQVGESGDTINIPAGATIANAGTASGFAPTGITSAMTSGTGLAIDANGIITKPLNTYVYAYMNADQVCDADDAVKVLQLNAELKDLNADFNVSNYTFTAPVDGAYLCTALIGMIENTAANVTDWFFGFQASNGNEVGFGGNPSPLETGSGSNYTKTVTFSKILYMDANDTMTLFADAYSGGSYTFKVDGHSNYYQATSMQINLLG